MQYLTQWFNALLAAIVMTAAIICRFAGYTRRNNPMSNHTDTRAIHPRSINPIWYAVAAVMCVVGLTLFYTLQTSGFSDPEKGFSIDMSQPLDKISKG